MELTQQQLNSVMRQNVNTILDYIAKGYIKFPDDLKKFEKDPKYKAIEEKLASIPDPQATQAWNEICAIPDDSADKDLIAKLSGFIARYKSNPGSAGMVEKAKARLNALTAAIEGADWQAVDRSSISSLLRHRRKYPSTVHEDEIDEMVWTLTDKTVAANVQRYMAEFPRGRHRSECDHVIEAQELWKGVSKDPDLVTLSDYIKEEPSSPFIDEANDLLYNLKIDEINKMAENPASYDLRMLRLLLDEGIFTKDELTGQGVATETTLKYIDNPPVLPDIEQTANQNPMVLRGSTDVFLFGIPSSGKTCVLMGLLGAESFVYDNAAEGSGGAYADDLYLYRRHGKAPGRTYGNFVTQIPGVLRPLNSPGVEYPINLIEMSGEEFAMKIAYNANDTVNFENMGTGATTLLTSDNRKVIFIVIDPTSDGLITIATEREDGSTVKKIVQQDIVINKIVNMLARNPQVLRKVNAIHFIMTKADILGDRENRDAIAVDRIKRLYYNTIENLRQICVRYSINTTSQNNPMLFTFSLGRFYLGDMFEYDVTDANKIMSNLQSMCQGIKQKGFFDKLKGTVN